MTFTWNDIAAKLDGNDFGPSLAAQLPIVIITWQGTGVDMWTGPPADTARAAVGAFPQLFAWQPVGNYPAATYPMGPSVAAGVAEGIRLATQVWPNNLLLPIGYSQGGICASHWWRDWCLTNGQQSRVVGAVTFGNPCRSPGYANGNAFAGWPMPGLKDGVVTGGISGPDCLTPSQTPATWLDFVEMGTDNGATELYTNCPVGSNPWTAEAQPGIVGTSIYNVVQNATVLDLAKVAADLFIPIGTVEEIINGLTFAGAGPAADHYNYSIDGAVEYLTGVVAKRFA